MHHCTVLLGFGLQLSLKISHNYWPQSNLQYHYTKHWHSLHTDYAHYVYGYVWI